MPSHRAKSQYLFGKCVSIVVCADGNIAIVIPKLYDFLSFVNTKDDILKNTCSYNICPYNESQWVVLEPKILQNNYCVHVWNNKNSLVFE